MPILISMEFKKLKRCKVINIVICTMFLFYLCAAAQGIKSNYSADRLLSETLIYATFLIVPALFSLLGSYMLSREYQDDTMKNNQIIPISIEKLIYAKLIACLIIGIIIFILLFILTIISILLIPADKLTPYMFFSNFKIYLLQSIGCFIASLPIIAAMSMIKNGCWISAVFAEMYSFTGLIAVSSKYRTIYPITAALGFSGAITTTNSEFIVCCFTMILSIIAAVAIIKIGRNIKTDNK